MARPLLPPRGVHVPARMIYNPQLSPAVILTWIQLRGLAWGGTVTPPLRMQELAALTGKSQATIYSHMSLLRHMLALSWRSTEKGKIIVTFANEPSKKLEVINPPLDVLNSKILDSKSLESNNPSSSPLNNTYPVLIPIEQENIKDTDLNHENKKYDYRIEGLKREEDSEFQESGMHSRNLESANPVDVYRELVRLTPNPSRRRILCAKVTNLPLWQQTLEHWLGHGWNPLNLTGMLELYERGGAAGCRYCGEPQTHAGGVKTAQESSRIALEDLRRELGIPSPSDGA